MHLHGFFFRVTRRGDEGRDSVTDDLVVTENMPAGGTMEMAWIPERPGNWLYHCHIPEHFSPRGSLGMAPAPEGSGGAHGNHGSHGVPHRLRFVQIDPVFSALRVELRRDTSFATWRLLAKDGADLPAERRVPVMSRVRLGIGETFDVEVTPEAGGTYRLEVRQGARYPLPVMRTLPIRVSNK